MHTRNKYEVCIFKPVARRDAVHTDDTSNDDDANNDARWTKHDCIRLFG